jgi:hypothetical protein
MDLTRHSIFVPSWLKSQSIRLIGSKSFYALERRRFAPDPVLSSRLNTLNRCPPKKISGHLRTRHTRSVKREPRDAYNAAVIEMPDTGGSQIHVGHPGTIQVTPQCEQRSLRFLFGDESSRHYETAGPQPPVASHHLASIAKQALIAEAELTPKPGLVDRRGSGAHTDLSLDLIRHSAETIGPFFASMEVASLVCACRNGP